MKHTVLMLAAALSCVALAAEPQKSGAADSSIQGIDLHMFSSRPTFGAPEDPTFWVHAERGEVLGDPPVWKLENTKAVIYRDPEEDIVLVAGSGNFDEENKSAQLDGGVRVTSGSLVAELAHIKWDDAAGVARSDAFTTFDDGMNRFVGQSIALYVDEDRFELGEGHGRIQLAAAQAEGDEVPKKSSEYQHIEILKMKVIEGGLEGGVRTIRGPAHLVLVGTDPADTLQVKADEIAIEYDPSKDEMAPSRILLKGNVELVHVTATFRSKSGNIDLTARTARFDGDVVMSGEQVEEARGDYFELNLETGDYSFGGEASSVKKIWLIAPEKAEKPADPKP